MDPKTILATIELMIRSLTNSWLSAVRFVQAAENIDSESAAAALWQEAVTIARVTTVKLDAAKEYRKRIASLRESGLITGEDWEQVWTKLDELTTEIERAESEHKNAGATSGISPDESSKEWHRAVAFALFWRITVADTPFSPTAKRRNNKLLTVARDVQFTTNREDELSVLRAVSTTGLRMLGPVVEETP